MAVDMSQESVLKTLAHLYGPESDALTKVKAIIKAGSKVTFGLFQFKIESGDKVFSAQLPAMSTKIATPGGMPTPQLQLIATKLSGVIDSAYQHVFPNGPVKMPPFPGETIKTESKVVEEILKAESISDKIASAPKPKMPFMEPKKEAVKAQMYGAGAGGTKVDDVIALRDAKAIGQKVKGTSGGSVYNAVAIGPVNFAVKFTTSNCSIRAESNDMTAVLKAKLKHAGFTDNGTYWSMHMKLNGVQAMRAIGAVLYSMDMPFEAMGTTTAQVVS